MNMIKAERASEYIAKQNKIRDLQARVDYVRKLISLKEEMFLYIKTKKSAAHAFFDEDHDKDNNLYLDGHSQHLSFIASNETLGFLIERFEDEMKPLLDSIAEIEAGN